MSMMNQNTAPTGGNVISSTSNVETLKTECEKHQNKADESYKSLPNELTKNKNNTTSAGGYEGSKPSFSAFSNNTELAKYPEIAKKFLDGIDGSQITLCDGNEYPIGGCRQKGHTEVKIIANAVAERAAGRGGKILTIAINWRQNLKGKSQQSLSKMPCPNCHRLICTTLETCDFDIILCNGEDEKVDMKKYCGDGGPQVGKSRTKKYKEGRSNLKEALDGEGIVL